jgi:hypothetical protein
VSGREREELQIRAADLARSAMRHARNGEQRGVVCLLGGVWLTMTWPGDPRQAPGYVWHYEPVRVVNGWSDLAHDDRAWQAWLDSGALALATESLLRAAACVP